ncbi:hypothetical protein SSS_00978 [Sarcoptes scabiei]|uniref:Uncharacterized protein n=1 Tax=Sarcoptes scabiei TaxID=52283 RepID=A0A834RFK8_SARSC|nr:hypothetical protein SSS_00978 [Sarcoptes scabiei]
MDFSFRFRNPKISNEIRRSIIESIIFDLDLRDARNKILSRCSLEERIKAQIGMCLSTVDKPNLIWMEEPLSDLDNVVLQNFVNLLKRLARTYSIAITLSVSQILDSDVLVVFDKLYVLALNGFCIYEGSVEHISLFLRESDVVISSRIQTPIERLLKFASKPNEITTRLANQVHSTRKDILHFGEKNGRKIKNSIRTEISDINLSNLMDLFKRCWIHKHRFYWKTLTIQFCSLIGVTVFLAMVFGQDIGSPDSCYHEADFFDRLTSIKDDRNFYKVSRDKDEHRNGGDQNSYNHDDSNQKIDFDDVVYDERFIELEEQKLVEKNIKFLFVLSIGLPMFHLLGSIINWNEEIIVACNEHRNGRKEKFFSKNFETNMSSTIEFHFLCYVWCPGFININSFIFVKSLTDVIVPTINTFFCCSLSYILLYFNIEIDSTEIIDNQSNRLPEISNYNSTSGESVKTAMGRWRFWLFFHAQLSSVLAAQNLGSLISAVAVIDYGLSKIITFSECILLIIFSGYLMPLARCNVWLKSISFISFIKQSFQMTLISLYGFNRCNTMESTDNNQTIKLKQREKQGKQRQEMSFVMREYGLEESFENFWFDTVIIQVHYLLYSLLFWFVLVKHINPNIFTDLWEEIKHFFLRESKMINNLMRVINSSTVSDQTSDEISFKMTSKLAKTMRIVIMMMMRRRRMMRLMVMAKATKMMRVEMSSIINY